MGDGVRVQPLLDRAVGAAQHLHDVLALRGVQRGIGVPGLRVQGVHDPVRKVGQVGRVQREGARRLGRVPVRGQLRVGQHREVHGAADRTGGGAVEVLQQVVLRALGLIDRGAGELPRAGAVRLPPGAVLQRDPSALHLDHCDPDARPEHQQIRLDLLAAGGDALPGDQHRLGGQLLGQVLPHLLLGGAGEVRLLGKSARHGAPRCGVGVLAGEARLSADRGRGDPRRAEVIP